MRDFRDAKAMAHLLRDALKAKAIQTTHSESLELIAKAFGYDNWNILSARIDSQNSSAATSPQNQTPQEKLLYCSFCGKSQHEVHKLIAGPAVFICDECIDLCVDIVDEQLLRLTEGDETSARAMSTERLQHYVEHATKGAERNRLALQRIESMIAYADNVPAIDDSAMPPSSSPFRNKTAEELRVMQKHSLDQLKRYEQAMRTATPIINERMASS
jgi:hypothetical protein